MQEKNNKLVEEAILQMKQVEEAIAENAKGILQSTMKEEISQLVKESLSEQDDEEMGVEVDDTEVNADNLGSEEEEDDVETSVDYEDEDDENLDLDFDDDSEEESPIDLTDASDEEILRVFKAMGEDDGIIVKKDGEDIHLKDDDDEYLIKLGESEEEQFEIYDEMEEESENVDNIIKAIFSGKPNEMDEIDDVVYEIEFDEEDSDIMDYEENDVMEGEYEDEDEEDSGIMEYEENDVMEGEYEDEDEEDSGIMEYDDIEESYNPKKAKKGEHKEGKMSIKPKGVGLGKGPGKVHYKTNTGEGFDEDMPEGKKSIGTGKAKFTYKHGENLGGKNKVVKKSETKEAARTLGNGREFREGGLPKPRAASKFNINANVKESLEKEILMLREKNDEYRKALNVFREKLTEVAIFNSNLAYATRLFTEHSTTKKEKINILRRFDNVATLKESKILYKSIKDELSNTQSKSINESVGNTINRTVSSGSSTSLIESKTYENPQFLRMKDLMIKIG
jgi:hypothetical protein